MILCANPKLQYESHKAEIEEAFRRVLARGLFILGPEVSAFEEEFAAFVGVRHAIGVGSGTEALHIALKASGIVAGDEVITVSHTAVATVSAIRLAGATPVYVDIDPGTFTIDCSSISKHITPRTKVILPVHLYGHPVDMKPIMDIAADRGIRVIEDCAQAHGAVWNSQRVGSIGSLGCFSFYPTKNLGALGDGGLITTNDDRLAEACRLLRQYGWKRRYESDSAGWNSRLDELQAAVLRVKLSYLDSDNRKRRSIAEIYTRGLVGLPLSCPVSRKDVEHVFHLYVVRSGKRDELLNYLNSNGVGALVHYRVPVHLQSAYRESSSPDLPETERATSEILSLPMYPELEPGEIEQVVRCVRSFYGA